MYFSSVPKGNWPPAVDARPPTQPKGIAIGVSLDSRGTDVGRTESSPPMSEKTQGKRAAADEPAQKRRKMVTAAPNNSGSISLSDDQTIRT